MISKADVEKLADLALIDVPEKEQEGLAKEMDAILDYVSDVSKLAEGEDAKEAHEHRNIMRDDVVTNKDGEYTDAIVAQFPDRDGPHLRVKKIL
jgi:aspartyl-tRNA(Asn)/glutamyl-tRNA(Gln) amidotransferase subunit C